jgi:hypothetical protein
MLKQEFVSSMIAAAGRIAGGAVQCEYEGVSFSAQKCQRSDTVQLADAGAAPRVKFTIMVAVADLAGEIPVENGLIEISGTNYRMGYVSTDPSDLSYLIEIVEDK